MVITKHKKLYQQALFIFRRDLRLVDNIGLLKALSQSQIVIPCFIFDNRQIGEQNHYASNNAIQFMLHSLQELNKSLKKRKSKLYLFYGRPEKIINILIKKYKIEAVFCNSDYTPFSISRDKAIESVCNKNKCIFIQSHDLLLHKPEQIASKSGTPYIKFTPFFKKASGLLVEKPKLNVIGVFYKHDITQENGLSILQKMQKKYFNHSLHVKGGTKEALRLLKNTTSLKNYAKTHDIPSLATTNLSAHLKFGTLSIRQLYWYLKNNLGNSHPLIRQLFWRDFFTYTAYHSPSVFGHAFQKKYDDVTWKNNIKHFNAWCYGKTGFPIVDAGMRQLNKTGFMHNRTRLITASFLVKDLHIDWRWGEKYFAQKLVDYDPCINNGNWQWVASTDCDAQPYFRIFNPWLQQKKFDPECIYIKKWIPELKKMNPKIIHALYKSKILIKNYPDPIIDHSKESIRAKYFYKHL